MNFEIRKTTNKEEYQYFLIENNEKILLSRIFSTLQECLDEINYLIEIGDKKEHYKISKKGNDYFLNILSDEKDIIVSSNAYSSLSQANTLIYLLSNDVFKSSQFEITSVTSKRPAKRVELSSLYDFSFISEKPKRGFHLYKKEGWFYYVFIDDGKEIILYGKANKTKTKREADILSVINRVSKDASYVINAVAQGYFFSFLDKKGKEIARSTTYSTQQGCNSAILALKMFAPKYKSIFSVAQEEKKRLEKKKKAAVDQYDFSQSTKSGQFGFDIFQNERDQKFYFHFNGEDGHPFLFSQAYASAKSRDNGIRTVIKNGTLDQRYVKKENNGKHFFIIKAGNNQEIARSHFYTTMAKMDSDIFLLKNKILDFAETYNVSKEAILSHFIIEKETFVISKNITKQPIAATNTEEEKNVIPAIEPEIINHSVEDEKIEQPKIVLPLIPPTVDVPQQPIIKEIIEEIKTPPITSPPIITHQPTVEKKTDKESIQKEIFIQKHKEAPHVVPPIKEAAIEKKSSIKDEIDASITNNQKLKEKDMSTTRRTNTYGPANRGNSNNAFDLGGCLSKFWPVLLLIPILILSLLFFRGCEGCGKKKHTNTSNETEKNTNETTTDTASVSTTDIVDDGSSSNSDSSSDYNSNSSSNSNDYSSNTDYTTTSSSSGSGGGSSSSKPYRRRGTSSLGKILDYLNDPSNPLPKSFPLGTITYDPNSAEILKDPSKEINELAVLLTKAYPYAQVRILGHIDGREDEEYNGKYQCNEVSNTLSQTRANCLYCNLYKRGVGKWRMQSIGKGSASPIRSNNSRKGRSYNRRVEIEFLTRN